MDTNNSSANLDSSKGKSWIKRHPILSGIGIIIGIILISSAFGENTPSNTNTNTNSANQSQPENNKGIESEDVAPVSQKSYQQIFTFSGNGTKKSEPFVVSGDRFKIAYDCKGDYCGAFVYEVGSSLPQGIMNSGGSIKDETVIYGSGEYYIDANTMGSFSMTVYDYK